MMLSALGASVGQRFMIVPSGSLAYVWNHDPYTYRTAGPPGDPENIFNQFDPYPMTLVYNTDPYNMRIPGQVGDPENIFNQFEMNW